MHWYYSAWFWLLFFSVLLFILALVTYFAESPTGNVWMWSAFLIVIGILLFLASVISYFYQQRKDLTAMKTQELANNYVKPLEVKTINVYS